MLSDYFFDQLQSQSDLTTTEGKAQSLTKAKPLLDKIPEGFYKEMMQNRLHSATGSRQIGTHNRRQPSAAQPGTKQTTIKIKPARMIAGLLVQQPKLASLIIPEIDRIKRLNFPGIELLWEIIDTINHTLPENNALLLEHFRGHEHEKTILDLSNLNLSVAEQTREAVFRDALKQLIKQADEDRINQLLAKTGQQGLTEEEKLELRNYRKK